MPFVSLWHIRRTSSHASLPTETAVRKSELFQQRTTKSCVTARSIPPAAYPVRGVCCLGAEGTRRGVARGERAGGTP